MTPPIPAPTIASNLAALRARIPQGVTLIAISKTQSPNAIREAIAAGQRVFGENRVQEAATKFPALKAETPELELHLIGPLQSNKARDAVALFDAIHTLDRDSLAQALACEIKRAGRSPKLFVQVNTGEEPQKSGLAPKETLAFITRCRDEFGLAITGLMCLPPADEEPSPHFALLLKLARKADLLHLSMGMSNDYQSAIALGATHVRIGSAIFGERI